MKTTLWKCIVSVLRTVEKRSLFSRGKTKYTSRYANIRVNVHLSFISIYSRNPFSKSQKIRLIQTKSHFSEFICKRSDHCGFSTDKKGLCYIVVCQASLTTLCLHQNTNYTSADFTKFFKIIEHAAKSQ